MTTLFLATTGGHLEQLEKLASRMPLDGDEVWVTHANEQSRSLLRDRDTEFVPYVRVRSLSDVACCVPAAHRLLRQRKVTRAISTGSGIALGYLPYLASRGVECHYIESAARVLAPSLTGRVLEHVPKVRRYTQYQSWANRRWSFRGSVFDSYTSHAKTRHPSDVLRVVVTVGTAAEFPFPRLLTTLAPLLADDGALAVATGRRVEVLWQTGCTSTQGLPITATSFLGADELASELSRADVVVSHAGTGSALGALDAGRCSVLVPRSEQFGEAGDDHQKELGAELQRRGLAVLRELADLTVDDLLASMERCVRRSNAPLDFALQT